MTTTPTLNGLILGQAERATRALLDQFLAGVGTTFDEWVVLKVSVDNEGSIDRDALTHRLTTGLKIDAPAAAEAIDRAIATGLIGHDSGGGVRVTDAGTAQYATITDGIGAIASRLYGDLATDDLTTAARVLLAVTDRANAALVA